MKIVRLALVCLFPLAGIAQDKFEISGTLSKVGTGRTVLLQYRNSKGINTMDSAKVLKGKFLLRGTTAFSNKATLSLLPTATESKQPRVSPDEQLFFLEKGKYILTGTDSITKARLTGTPSQNEYAAYRRQIAIPTAECMALLPPFMAASAANDSVEIKKIQARLMALSKTTEAIRDSFIFSHPDSYVSLDLVDNEVAVTENPRYYAALSKRVLASFAGRKLTARVAKAKLMSLGRSVDFTQPDDKGKEFTLSSLKGKYVLVDFWASWCGFCRLETPYLLRAYNALKDKNFEIVSISLDENKEAWLKAVREDKMPWIQVADLKGFKNEVADRFGIISIPRNILIDPDGVIIAKNLRGENVMESILALIKQPR